jgi:hypothetical protein
MNIQNHQLALLFVVSVQQSCQRTQASDVDLRTDAYHDVSSADIEEKITSLPERLNVSALTD